MTSHDDPVIHHDVAVMAETLRMFVQPGGFGEARWLGRGMNGTYFRHDQIDRAAKFIASEARDAKGVYLVMNEIDPEFAREKTLLCNTSELTSDENIIRRRSLLVDFDPHSKERKANDSSTDDEKQSASDLRELVAEYLASIGFPAPAWCDSSNGYHLLYRIDLPNDEQSLKLIADFLGAISKRFSTDNVGIDITVKNASRITKLYGTVSRKGEHRPDRPHRLSSIQDKPSDGCAVVPEQLLRAVIDDLTPAIPAAKGNLHDFVMTPEKYVMPPVLQDGQKHGNMTKIAGAVRSFGATADEIFECLKIFKRTRTSANFDDDGIRKIADDIGRKDCNLPMKALIEAAGDDDKYQEAERQQKIKLAIEHASKSLASGRSLDEILSKLQLTINEAAVTAPTEFKVMTSAELDSADLRTEYLVDYVLAAKQPCVIAAGKKSLKTTVAIDLALSLASGAKFLNHFYVTRALKVALMSGESGDATIQETARRIARSKPWVNLADYENVIWSFDLPKLGRPQTKAELTKFIRQHGPEVLIIDPAYLCLDLGEGAGNLFEVGAKLLELTEICQETGCLIAIIHHNRKSRAENQYDSPDLENIAWAGFQEWARQWILLGRREAYDPENSGSHRLWLVTGGSAGHSGKWALDVEEGSQSDPGGRRWDVTVQTASKAIAELIETRQDAQQQRAETRAQRQLKEDADKLLILLKKYPDGETEKFFRERAKLSGSRSSPAIQELLDNGLIENFKIEKNSRPFPAIRLVKADRITIGPESGLTGNNPACPDDWRTAGLSPLRGSPDPAHRDIDDSNVMADEKVVPDSRCSKTHHGGRPA